MTNKYNKIVQIIREDIDKLEQVIAQDIIYPTEELKSLVLAPAKRIRPVLAFLFLRANGIIPNDEQFLLQSAIELVHSASLVHDDIIDESTIRRGQETFNSKYSDKLAVLSGDYLLSLALKILIDLDKNEILKEFFATFETMVMGEISQYFSKGEIPSIEEYIEKSIAKTANLFKLAVGSSAKQANLNIPMAEDFGLNFGIAFQIMNDLEDVLGTKSDLKNKIYTAPTIFGGKDAIDKTKSLINIYIKRAKDAIKDLPQNEYKQALEEILEYLIND